MTQHALLSASAAHRWLACPPSARLAEKTPSTTSPYAEEGRKAHAVAEQLLLHPDEKPACDAEMLDYVNIYVSYVREIINQSLLPATVMVEEKVDYGEIVPLGFGTADCIIIRGNTMQVIDLKYGKGVPVSAENNPQMMLYALGALAKYRVIYDIKNVRLSIMQPRLNEVASEWELTAAALQNWGESIKPIARKAYAGEGAFRAGEHCRFCPAKATCRTRRDLAAGIEITDPQLLTDTEIGAAVLLARAVSNWAKEIEDYALSACLAGRNIEGWKAVEGRKDRMFTDTQTAFDKIVAAGYEKELLYERKPLTLTRVEQLLGKKQFNIILEDCITRKQGKPTLVQTTDKREAITNNITAAEAFKEDF